jgi:hypothetical protein
MCAVFPAFGGVLGRRRRSIELTAAVLILLPLAIAAAPQTPKVCRACRTQCPAEIASCVQADPRLATCSPKRQKFCLRRAARPASTISRSAA